MRQIQRLSITPGETPRSIPCTNRFPAPSLLDATLLLAIFILFMFCLVGPSYASFTAEDEIKLGKEFYDKLEKSHVLIHDSTVEAYINRIGQKILSKTEKAPFDFQFNVIKSSAINAFATPGGYVYLNKGLINLVETESELAGVLAHEIAHVNARHIASTIEKSQKVSIGTLAAIMAGAFLGGGSDLSAAVTTFSLATATSLSLKYSRENEEEADRLGLNSMLAAGYDGKAMIDFMKIMRRYEFYSNSVPSYFLTHPGTDERIRYLDASIQTMSPQKGSDSLIGNLKRIQTILIVGEKNLETGLSHFKNELKKDPNDIDALYGLAILQEKSGMTAESLVTFQKALAISPADDDILRDLGVLYFNLGRLSEAVNSLRNASDMDKEDVNTRLYLGRSYAALGNYQEALDIFKNLEKTNIPDVDVHYDMAMAYGKKSDPGNSHYYFGMYFKKQKKTDSALFHFKEALKYVPSQSDRYLEIEKEISTLSQAPYRSGGASIPSKRK
jgi:beta-barrel assembly-enhancing protease